MDARMKNLFENNLLIIANIGAWTVNDLSILELWLKVVLLLITIAIGLRKLFRSKKEKSDVEF